MPKKQDPNHDIVSIGCHRLTSARADLADIEQRLTEQRSAFPVHCGLQLVHRTKAIQDAVDALGAMLDRIFAAGGRS